MKTAGIIGGIGPEATIEYYRLIIAAYRERRSKGDYPSLIINSIDLNKMLELIGAKRLVEVTEFLLRELKRLAQAGADFGVLAANSPHIVFDDLRRQSPIPLISIVEVTSQAAHGQGFKRVGLFGPRFVMQERFYPDVFSRVGIQLVLPTEREQGYIHDTYFSELVKGVIQAETRDTLLEIVDKLKEREGIEALILGGTELSLILRDGMSPGIPFLDTTRIHAKAVVEQLLS